MSTRDAGEPGAVHGGVGVGPCAGGGREGEDEGCGGAGAGVRVCAGGWVGGRVGLHTETDIAVAELLQVHRFTIPDLSGIVDHAVHDLHKAGCALLAQEAH
jgi:hypothetical protein